MILRASVTTHTKIDFLLKMIHEISSKTNNCGNSTVLNHTSTHNMQ